MHPSHPLLVGVPDRKGAAFGTIYQVHTADSFATKALQKLDAFLDEAGCDMRYVFERHPLQSTVRVLLQLDAPEPAILEFWTDLQDRLAPVEPWLLYFRESDPGQAMEASFDNGVRPFRAMLLDQAGRNADAGGGFDPCERHESAERHIAARFRAYGIARDHRRIKTAKTTVKSVPSPIPITCRGLSTGKSPAATMPIRPTKSITSNPTAALA